MSQVRLPNGDQIILLPLRLTFGGSACPAEWCVVSEIITDLTNRILDHEHWDTYSIFPSLAPRIPMTNIYPPDIEYTTARPILVDLKLEANKVG
jgi:hypothetical protein